MRNMHQFGGWDPANSAQITKALRGPQSGTEYAEAFKVALAWLRMRASNVAALATPCPCLKA